MTTTLEVHDQTVLPGGPAVGDYAIISRLVVGNTLPSPFKYDVSQFLLNAGGTLSGTLTLSGNPSVALGAAPKQYADAAQAAEAARAEGVEATLLPIAGGTMTGPLTLSGNPTSALHAVPKQYADALAATAASGYGVQIGGVDMGSLKGLTIDPRLASSVRITVAGVLWCVKATLKPGVTVSQLLYNITTAGAGVAGCYFGIYSTTGALLASTADLTSTTPYSAGAHTASLSAPFTAGATAASVIIAILVASGTTMPTFTSGAGVQTGLTWGQDGTAGYPYFAYGTGLTTLPASLTLNSTNCTIAAPAQAVPLIGLN